MPATTELVDAAAAPESCEALQAFAQESGELFLEALPCRIVPEIAPPPPAEESARVARPFFPVARVA